MATVLITGANKGIGLEMAKVYVGQGDRVLACCRNPDGADALNAMAGDNLTVYQVDVASSESVQALKEAVGDTPIDILINNAGIAGPGPAEQNAVAMDYDGWAETFNVNTMGPLRVHQAFLGNLKAGTDPKSITITSQMGALDLNWPVMYAYCSSKAAVNKVFRMMSADPANEGVAIRLVHPGHVRTDMGGPNGEIDADESAAGIVKVIADTSLENTGTFLKWNGEVHAW